ncbi:MAG: cytochrome c [Sulfuriferula multivorans]|uniref:Cytochrome c n=1 Tax=Sulfuriferula multivorans TaxID=1559896 RepID=A0A7C9JY54_9PROT|nr:cytochrome c [Sulfuriferula multivorans]
MKRFLMGVLTTLIVGAGVGAWFVYSGLFDVSADTPHNTLVYRMIETARDNAIDRQVRDAIVPANLADDERIRRGAGNYAAMCVECHLAPGKSNSEIRMGLYPEPPDLAQPGKADAAARQFWVIKHGIKASGMPAWSKGGIEDESIWDIVAFLQKMPTLNADQYAALVESSEGHSHGGPAGGDNHHDEAASAHAPHDAAESEHGHAEKTAPVAAKKKPHDLTDGHAH